MSQTVLGNAVGVGFAQKQRYEACTNRISGSRLWMIGNALEVPITYFFEGMDQIPEPTTEPMPSAVIRTARMINEMPDGDIKNQIIRLINVVAKADWLWRQPS